MKAFFASLALFALAGCATVDYQPYEGKSGAVWEGQGGTKVVVDNVDFWDNGAPPRKYKVVGYATGAVGAGYGADGIIRGAVASKVKAQGGNAAILVNGNTTELGFVKASPSLWLAANTRELKYAVVQYVD